MKKNNFNLSDMHKTVGMVSAMFDLLCQGDQETSVKYRKRFYQNVEGISFPPDWDQLPASERAERLAKVDNVALKGVK